MKTIGWILLVIGVLAFMGAALKGHNVFGPLFWIGIGVMLLCLKKERVENKKKEMVTTQPKEVETHVVKEEKEVIKVDSEILREETNINDKIEQDAPVSFEQKEAAICLISFFSGYNDDIMTNDDAFMLSYQSALFFGIDDFKETLMTALPKYPDADKLIDKILTIKNKKAKEFILLTCYDLTKMSGKSEAYDCLYNIANDMGYDRERLKTLIDQYSSRTM